MFRSFKSIYFAQSKSTLIQNHVNIAYRQRYHSDRGVYGFKSKKKNQFYEVPPEHLAARIKCSNFYRLVQAYREHAHKQADIDPISISKVEVVPELNLNRYGLILSDFVTFKGILNNVNKDEGTVEEALEILNDVYSHHIGAEFSYLETLEEREWFACRFENSRHDIIDSEIQRSIAAEMLKSQNLDNFLAKKFVSLKRYGGEGAEAMMAFFYEFFRLSAEDNLEKIILCMPHRGRLNLLLGLLNFPPEKLFRKLRGLSEFPDNVQASGDVVSHFVSSTNLNFQGKKLHVSMLYNPSHLEAVNPVSMGKTRAIMQEIQDGDYSEEDNARWSDKVLNLQIHGDAAYVGQGINQESLALSATPHFEIGGTVHMVLNNQLGFTTPGSRGRSSRYCTDLAKFIAAPVLHVNGDEPEAVVRATRVAFEYQRRFRKDVFIDINCFRRWGHNELDDPTITNPMIYKIINDRISVPNKYRESLESLGILQREESDAAIEQHTLWLTNALKSVDSYVPTSTHFTGRWLGIQRAHLSLTVWDTGVDLSLLTYIIAKSVQLKDNLVVHANVMKNHIQARLKKLEAGENVDWATAEAAAFGSLLYQGYNVRISGQDVGRGTFSHRHAMLVDQSTGELYIPLNAMAKGQKGQLELANSILSEEAVLGFEYGISITSPFTLAVWEAQFGDFFNGAQIIIDTFITSGETKWMTSSGLTMLLPHGYDGTGPEHSSCRVERFLQLTDSSEDAPDSDDVNIQIANPTTAAQYFHLLRRQIVRNFRKPLIVVAPKILLRHASATSSLREMMPQTFFKNVIGDGAVNDNMVHKVILVSGKHYYALENYRVVSGIKNIAIIRLESLCPFPVLELTEELNKYPNAKSFIWSQEEPQNMGAWAFVKRRFENLCGRPLQYCGRKALASPAVGIGEIHQREAQEVIVKPFASN